MGFLNRLQREYLRRKLLPVPFFVAAALALFFLFSGPEALRASRPVPLRELSPEEWEGAYVSYEVPYIYGQYLSELEYRGGVNTGKATGGAYVIDVQQDDGGFSLLGLYIHGDADLLTSADTLTRRSRETGAPTPLKVWGAIRPLDGEDRAKFDETIAQLSGDYAAGAEEIEELPFHAEPYYIDAGRIAGKPAWLVRALLLLILPLLLASVWRVVQALKTRQFRPLRKKLAELGGGEVLDALLESFYDDAWPIGGVRVGRDFVLLPNYILLRPWEIVWAYREGGTVFLRTLDGAHLGVPMKPEEAEELLGEIQQLLPGTVVGYSDDVAKRYQEDRQSFADWWDKSRPGCYHEVIEERTGRLF